MEKMNSKVKMMRKISISHIRLCWGLSSIVSENNLDNYNVYIYIKYSTCTIFSTIIRDACNPYDISRDIIEALTFL